MAVGGVGGVGGFGGHSQVMASTGTRALTPEQQQAVNRLKATDREVRNHEQAHMAAGAGLTGGATLQFTRGPDGRQYAVAGEVSINLSAGKTPEETVERARQIQAAALAPVDPSPQDRAVAAAAAMMESQARAEMSRVRREQELGGAGGEGGVGGNTAASPLQQQAAAIRAYLEEAGRAEEAIRSSRIDLRI